MKKTVTKNPETRDQAVNRLAEEARTAGILVYEYPRTHEWFATSQRNPGELHRVTLLSCDCPGFFAHQRCRHHSALLDYCGELPPVEPTPLVALTPEERALQSVPTPATAELPDVLEARAELVRLSRDPKSTADFHRLHHARERVNTLITPASTVAVA